MGPTPYSRMGKCMLGRLKRGQGFSLVEVMVVVDSPRGNIFGGVVAAPAFQEIGAFLTQALSIRPDGPVTAG